MSRLSLKSDHLFIPALVVSASVHAVLITAHVWLPGQTDFSVMQAPNSLNFTVISQPFVSVIEEEIITEEIIDQEIADTTALNRPVKKNPSAKVQNSFLSSRESSGAVAKAKPLMQSNHAPLYPKIARQRGWEGTVRLNVLVEKDGMPSNVSIQNSSGHSVLDKVAVKAVKNWKFSPAQSGRLRFSSKIVIPIRFALTEQK